LFLEVLIQLVALSVFVYLEVGVEEIDCFLGVSVLPGDLDQNVCLVVQLDFIDQLFTVTV